MILIRALYQNVSFTVTNWGGGLTKFFKSWVKINAIYFK